MIGSFKEHDLFELRDLRIKVGKEGTGSTKAPRASVGPSGIRNTTCTMCSK